MQSALRFRVLASRLKALALAAVFAGGPAVAVTADLAHHHQDQQERHAGQHMERPGTCLDHAHACDLALAHSGPKLVSAGAPTHPATVVLSIRPTVAVSTIPTRGANHSVPARAPPLS